MVTGLDFQFVDRFFDSPPPAPAKNQAVTNLRWSKKLPKPAAHPRPLKEWVPTTVISRVMVLIDSQTVEDSRIGSS